MKTWDDLIKNAEDNYGKDSNIAKFWRETKEKIKDLKKFIMIDQYLFIRRINENPLSSIVINP